jgi:hypothetical protein
MFKFNAVAKEEKKDIKGTNFNVLEIINKSAYNKKLENETPMDSEDNKNKRNNQEETISKEKPNLDPQPRKSFFNIFNKDIQNFVEDQKKENLLDYKRQSIIDTKIEAKNDTKNEKNETRIDTSLIKPDEEIKLNKYMKMAHLFESKKLLKIDKFESKKVAKDLQTTSKPNVESDGEEKLIEVLKRADKPIIAENSVFYFEGETIYYKPPIKMHHKKKKKNVISLQDMRIKPINYDLFGEELEIQNLMIPQADLDYKLKEMDNNEFKGKEQITKEECKIY